MTIDEEEKMFKELAINLPKIVDQVLFNGDRAIEILEKLAIDGTFVFDRKRFFEGLILHKKLESALSILISIDTSKEGYDNIMKVIATSKTITEIDELFKQVHDLLETFNNLVINQHVDFSKYELVNRLKNILDFESIDYDDLEKALDKNSIYLVMRVEDMFDNREELYGNFNTLRLKSFKTKVDANKFCLSNGISRDFIICRYWGS